MKIPELCNDVLEFIWINPDSFINFLCCTHINHNMRILHFKILERCIDLCFVSHTMQNFVIGQGIGGKRLVRFEKFLF